MILKKKKIVIPTLIIIAMSITIITTVLALCNESSPKSTVDVQITEERINTFMFIE